MRYSIFEYSQEKLVDLELDVIDALLLNWFANFFSGKMEKQIFKDENGNSKIYGWVKISKIMEDLPVIGISTEKGIRNRFDSFVEKGILDRETINTQKGKKSFYKTTVIYDSLINTTAIEKKQNDETENLQRNSNSFAKENNKSKQENISQRKKTTYAKNTKEDNTKKSSQGNCSSYAKRNDSSLAERNSNSFALNNSLTNDYLNINTTSSNNNQTEEDLIKIINKLFENKIKFSSDLEEKLITSLQTSKLDNSKWKNYIYWAFDYLKSRCEKAENLPGYFYKSIHELSLIYKFEIQITETKNNQKLITCKICGDQHFQNKCPICNNYNDEIVILSENEILQKQKYFLMPNEQKLSYENEMDNIFKNYPILEVIKNRDLKKEMDLQIIKLNQKYGLEEIS